VKDWNDQKRSFTLTIPYSRSPKISDWAIMSEKVCLLGCVVIKWGDTFFRVFGRDKGGG